MSSGEELHDLSVAELVARAQRLGIPGAESMRREQLVSALGETSAERHRGRPQDSSPPASRAGGWLGRARELVARVVEQGLHMPEAANLLRTVATPPTPPPPPLPTVTLAEIYAAQGHTEKALEVLDQVLRHTPRHAEALALSARLSGRAHATAPRTAEAAAGEAANPASTDTPVVTAQPPVASETETANETAANETAANETAANETAANETAANETATRSSEAKSAVNRSSAANEPATAETTSRSSARPGAGLPESVGTDAATAPGAASLVASDATAPARVAPLDDVVCLPTDPSSMFVYWEVRPITFARARWRDPRGKLVLRIVSILASVDETRAAVVGDERDIDVDELTGERFVHGLPPGSEVRLCIGWLGPRGFSPLAIASEISMPRDYQSAVEATTNADQRLAASWREAVRAGRAALQETPAHRVAREHALTIAGRMNGGAVPIVELSDSTSTREVTRVSFGGASDLHRITDRLTERFFAWPHGPARMGGASERFGGASDLFGGASDLFGGASDLQRHRSRS